MVSVGISFLLGILQGLTEWFPVSSSGHLVIAQQLLGLDVPVAYDIYLHLGTMLVLFIYFWKDIVLILRAVLQGKFSTPHGMMGIYLVLGSLATLVVGLLFQDFFYSFFTDLRLVGWAFLFTGGLLFASRFVPARQGAVQWKSSLLIGLAQGIALIPGVSRSGATISLGMFAGVERTQVARFSFLLAIPAILGASLLQTIQQATTMVVFLQEYFLATVVGVATAAIVGWFSLRGLLWMVERGHFHYFSYYCLGLGVVLVSGLV